MADKNVIIWKSIITPQTVPLVYRLVKSDECVTEKPVWQSIGGGADKFDHVQLIEILDCRPIPGEELFELKLKIRTQIDGERDQLGESFIAEESVMRALFQTLNIFPPAEVPT